jgi:hypothetical protein
LGEKIAQERPGNCRIIVCPALLKIHHGREFTRADLEKAAK